VTFPVRTSTLLAIAVLAAGCGSSHPRPMSAADPARGRALFQTGAAEGCGFCHTLASAETHGIAFVDTLKR